MFFIPYQGKFGSRVPAVEKEFYEVLKCFLVSVEVIDIAHPREGGLKKSLRNALAT